MMPEDEAGELSLDDEEEYIDDPDAWRDYDDE